MNRARTFLGLFAITLAWSSWQSLTYDCTGGFSCRHTPPPLPWADPLVVLAAALLLADLLGRRLLGGRA